ncbi:MAG: hypothetical protein Q4D05_08845 [Acinetobacter sp.]|nr:hypothetical protein [Acinetobacter sp.]
MKSILLFIAMMFCVTSSYAGLQEMMKIYNNPKSAPKVKGCQGDVYCNAFVALSKQWRAIPNNYRYKGEWDIKAYARRGISYDSQGRNIGLWKGFYFYTDRSNLLIDRGYEYQHNIPNLNFEGGLAVLLYIEDRNGWIKEFPVN